MDFDFPAGWKGLLVGIPQSGEAETRTLIWAEALGDLSPVLLWEILGEGNGFGFTALYRNECAVRERFWTQGANMGAHG